MQKFLKKNQKYNYIKYRYQNIKYKKSYEEVLKYAKHAKKALVKIKKKPN